MTFLSTAELTEDMLQERNRGPTGRTRSTAMSEEEFNVQVGNFESRAYRAQEEKIKQLTTGVRAEFWKGMQKEHELVGVFSKSYRNLRTQRTRSESGAWLPRSSCRVWSRPRRGVRMHCRRP